MARVTVVIAARDAASTLPETLSSLVAQTVSDWEAIVVDDASEDGTGDAARGFDPRIRVVRHATPQGPGASRNDGVRQATTELVSTLDADDLWKPEYLNRQLAAYDAAMADGRPVALVCTDAELIDEGGRVHGRWSQRIPLPPSPDLTDLLRENFVYNSVLVPREEFLSRGGYAAELIRGEDFDLWLRIVESGGEIVVNPEPLACYRLRAGALSANTVELSASTGVVYRRALERGRLTPAQRRLVRRQMRLHALLERRARRQAEPSSRPRRVASALLLLLPTIRVALEHPERWAAWARRGARPPATGRHA
jgi:glycosyltransferase involved in cell wall biosynthesis